MRRRRALVPFVAALLLSSGPAAASGIAVYALPQPDSPVALTSCNAGIRFASNAWGTNSSLLDIVVDFRNQSSRNAVAVLFRFQLTNATASYVDNIFEQSSGSFATNTLIKGNHWSNTDMWPGLGIVQCSVSRVQFSDGSAWNEPKVKPSPPPTTN